MENKNDKDVKKIKSHAALEAGFKVCDVSALSIAGQIKQLKSLRKKIDKLILDTEEFGKNTEEMRKIFFDWNEKWKKGELS